MTLSQLRKWLASSVFGLLAAGCLCVAMSGAAGPPTVLSPRSGQPHVVPLDRDFCWDEPMDLYGIKASSEIIGEYDLESECANDFLLDEDAVITAATAYGGYYNWLPGDPDITGMNWLFYGDTGCVPEDAPFVAWYGDLGEMTLLGYDGYGYPTYSYRNDAIVLECAGGTRYWFVAQAADHIFPPQWGRQSAAHITDCEGMFRSEFFGHPDWWLPEFGGTYDFSQSFECGVPTPTTRRSTWGAVRSLYR